MQMLENSDYNRRVSEARLLTAKQTLAGLMFVISGLKKRPLTKVHLIKTSRFGVSAVN